MIESFNKALEKLNFSIIMALASPSHGTRMGSLNQEIFKNLLVNVSSKKAKQKH